MPTKDTSQIKESIIESIRRNGPSLPVHVAKEIETSMLFTSAFLSELLSEQKIVMSHMKVGSSPVYLIKGQEEGLEKYAEQHLKSKEKEAYKLLKEKGFLEDEKEPPPIRVALRAIKDFAFPFEKNGKIIWKYLTEDIQNYERPKEKETQELPQKEQTPEPPKEEPKKIIEHSSHIPQSIMESIKKTVETRDEIESNPEPKKEPIQETNRKTKEEENEEEEIEETDETEEELDIFDKSEKNEKEKSVFIKEVLNHIKTHNFKIKEELSSKKREYNAIITVNSDLGPLDVILHAKEKKTFSTDDLMKAVKEAQDKNMQVLYLSHGELSKKSQEFYTSYSNLVRFRKL